MNYNNLIFMRLIHLLSDELYFDLDTYKLVYQKISELVDILEKEVDSDVSTTC